MKLGHLSKMLWQFAGCAMAAGLMSGCGTPPKITGARLDALGVRVGAPYWEAAQNLHREGYACFVNGAKREDFDCTRDTGFLITCILRVRFVVDDENRIASVVAPEPACMGTP